MRHQRTQHLRLRVVTHLCQEPARGTRYQGPDVGSGRHCARGTGKVAHFFGSFLVLLRE